MARVRCAHGSTLGDVMQNWWAALGRPRRIMLIAIALMTLSQFFDYDSGITTTIGMPIVGGGGGDHVEANLATGAAIANASITIPGTTGWTLHPHARLILGALALLFATGLALGEWWLVWGYWIAVAGLVVCLYPFDLGTPGVGALAGLIATGLGIWAARANAKRPKPA